MEKTKNIKNEFVMTEITGKFFKHIPCWNFKNKCGIN